MTTQTVAAAPQTKPPVTPPAGGIIPTPAAATRARGAFRAIIADEFDAVVHGGQPACGAVDATTGTVCQRQQHDATSPHAAPIQWT